MNKIIDKYLPEAVEKKKKKTTINDVESMLDYQFDKISRSKGAFIARKSFFYRFDNTVDKYVDIVKKLIPNVKIIDSGEVWKPFKGGAPIEKQSHWYVKFTVD